MSDPLFSPLTINHLTLKNRIVMPAMHLNYCRGYQVNERLLDFYAARAAGGAGLIVVGFATVDSRSGNPGNIGAHDDIFLPGLTRLAAAIHAGGAAAAVQLNHAGRYNYSLLMGGESPVAPSPVASRLTGETPRELSTVEIDEIVAAFASAATRVKAAGFDAIEILAGTGYLISEFLSPLTNRRSDDYGGSFENRCRFADEVLAAVRAAVGPDFPLLVRLNGNDFIPGGIGRDELRRFAQRMTANGADALCVNVGWHESQVPQIVTKVPRAAFAYLSRDIRTAVTVPVIASHRINDPAVARNLLAQGACDLVAMGRALIADPQLPAKAAAGSEASIIHCVACAQGCFDNLFRMKGVECLCNPRAGHEKEHAPVVAATPRRVLVVGGGAAGMSAALSAAECGHQVRLCEAESRLGGQLHLAGAPPGREEFALLAADLESQLLRAGVEVRRDCYVDETLLDEFHPEAVILATGGKPVTPAIPGVDLPQVVQAWEVLAGRAAVGRRVVVIGGGAVGIETSLLLSEEGTLSAEELKFLLVHQAEGLDELYRLATNGNRSVTMIEMLGDVGTNFGRSTRWVMLQDLRRYGINTRTNARVLEITPGGVRIECAGEVEDVQADTVVLAVGTVSYNPLQKAVEQRGVPCQVVGDARAAALVFDAIHQGFKAGRAI